MAGLEGTLSSGLTSTLGIQVKAKPGIPWWGSQSPKYIGGGTGFQTPPSLWDVVLFGPNSQPLPGLARVKRCERRMKLHRKEHPSSDFETQTFQGWSVVEFDFDLELWSLQQLRDLSGALAYLFPGAGDPPDPKSAISVATVSSTQNLVNPSMNSAQGTQVSQQIQVAPNTPKRPPIPVKMSHPALQLHGVDTVVVERMNGPVQKSPAIPDIFVINFKCVQFKPSKAVAAKTLNQAAATLPTPLGDLGGGGLGVLQPQYLPPAQQPNQDPSSSGGADPFNAGQYVNFNYTP